MEIKIMSNKTFIGLCGVARCGKDTMCNAMIEVLKTHGLVGKRASIADSIRSSLYKFIKEEFNIDIWNASLSEKEIIRGIMVEFGLAKRAESKGVHLTDALQPKIDLEFDSGTDVIIVPDIRYDVYPKDELYWAKVLNEGKIVHISKIVSYNEDGTPNFLPPVNEQEVENDPKLKAQSDYAMAWETKGEFNDNNSEYYLNKAEVALKYLKII